MLGQMQVTRTYCTSDIWSAVIPAKVGIHPAKNGATALLKSVWPGIARL
jgi:hypothetical protein